LTVPEVRRLLAIALPLPARSPEVGLVAVPKEDSTLGPSQPLPTTRAPATLSSTLSWAFITTVVGLGGRPKAKTLDTPKKVAMVQALYNDRSNSIVDICKTLRISRATLYRYVKTGQKVA